MTGEPPRKPCIPPCSGFLCTHLCEVRHAMEEVRHPWQSHSDGGSWSRAGTSWPSCSSQKRAQELGQISLMTALSWLAYRGSTGGVGGCLSRGVGRGRRRRDGGIRWRRGREGGLRTGRRGHGHGITWKKSSLTLDYTMFKDKLVFLFVLS